MFVMNIVTATIIKLIQITLNPALLIGVLVMVIMDMVHMAYLDHMVETLVILLLINAQYQELLKESLQSAQMTVVYSGYDCSL